MFIEINIYKKHHLSVNKYNLLMQKLMLLWVKTFSKWLKCRLTQMKWNPNNKIDLCQGQIIFFNPQKDHIPKLLWYYLNLISIWNTRDTNRGMHNGSSNTFLMYIVDPKDHIVKILWHYLQFSCYFVPGAQSLIIL